MRNLAFTFCLGLALAAVSGPPALADASLTLVGQWDSGIGEGTEVVSVQDKSARAAVTNAAEGTVTILDLSNPAVPTVARIVDLGLRSGEGVTSVAFHPTEDYFVVTIETDGEADNSCTTDDEPNSRIEIRDASTGAVLKCLQSGSEPDAVAISEQGQYAVVSNEGESFTFNAATGGFDSPDGSVTVVDLRYGPARATAAQVALPDATGTVGMVTGADNRFLEREVDLNGDGVIDEDTEVLLIPLVDNSPKFLEPELATFSKNGNFAFVTLQENNGVAVIDVRAGKFVEYYGLGITQHAADTQDDGMVVFDDDLVALREPDGITMTPDGRYFVTADEGDTDPKASETPFGLPTGGGRTVSVFDAATGALLGDTGNQIDATAAFEVGAFPGVYPDGRSDSKGSEPENLATFRHLGTIYAAVGLERADAVALISLADPENPMVVQVAPVNPGTELGSQAPEGIATLNSDGSLFVYAANEGSGIVSVFEVTPF